MSRAPSGKSPSNSRKSIAAVLLFDRTIFLLLILWSVSTALLLFYNQRAQQEITRQALLDSAQSHSQVITDFRTLYSSEVIRVARGQVLPISHEPHNVEGAIPLPITLARQLSQKLNESGNMGSFDLYSPYPFPWHAEQGGLKDTFAQDAWDALSEDPTQPFFRIEDVDGQPSLRYATPDLMRTSCLDCHNNHPQTPKTGWQEGDLRGVIEVRIPTAQWTDRTAALLLATRFFFVILFVAGLIGIGLVIGRLKQESDRLEEEVETRTQELTTANDRLTEYIYAKELADSRESLIGELEVRNQELERFAYTVTHDLRSPLITIQGFSQHLEEDALSGDVASVKEGVKQILTATDHMTQFVENLLRLSRSGRFLGEMRTQSMVDIAEAAVHLCLGRLRNAGVQIEIDPDLPEAHCDGVRLTQAFQNLIENAARFMGDTEDPKIQIGHRKDGDEWAYFVADNGMGIAPEHQTKIFDLFESLDRGSGGSGIGLALVARIIEAHDGRIWVESDGEDSGSIFLFTLPGSGKA